MRTRALPLLALLALLVPNVSLAEVKTYSMDILRVNNTTTLTITGRSFPSWRFGSIEIDDESNASPTLKALILQASSTRTGRVDVFGGLNAFVYVRTISTISPQTGQTGTGDSEGFVQWNPLSSWTPQGGVFCKSSNETGAPLGGPICALVGFSQEGTAAQTVPSAVYDFNLWTFDQEGDLSSEPYLWQISANGAANTDYLMNASLNVNIPALSILGFGVLGASLLFLGIRALRSQRSD